MNSKILHLQLFIYHSDLNTKILNKYVFKQLKEIDLNGQITKIQDDSFKSFEKLNFLRFRIQYVKNVLVYNNKWLNNINYDIDINPEYNSLNESKIQIEKEISIKVQENKNITEQISILQNELKKRDEEKALFETQYSNLEKEIDTFKSCLKISKDENNLLTESINQMNNHFEKVENDIIEKNNEIETFKLKLEEQFFSLVQENSQNSNLVINIKNLNSELIILNQNSKEKNI